ncbi:acetate/propionate family kinase [Bradyrhizobium canariense]|uniref:Acetate kinase n=1 Tax=Bradyrhizobium canariense TaxID=255045 RepID=A0A1H1SU56_9BRAD|nr:acetate/propionate family kinase [Bradyrhizobium canariense]SDS51522.1 acetate kinase [Bradyrhizobium canariense]
MADAVLTLNAGSSSIKFSLFEIDGASSLRLASQGEVEGIGSAPHFSVRDKAGTILADQTWPAPHQAFESLLEGVIGWTETHLREDSLIAVGHRVVHGGPDHYRPELATPDLLAALDRLTPLAPLHEPHNVAPIRAIAAARPKLPQVACFDTAFHHTMPAVATRFALPREYEDAGVRRYGFHGLSYEYIAGRLREIAPDLARGRVIAAHLGNGASLCAMHDGHSVDTTMGFTALDGLVMGTRSGNLDPGVILYLQEERGLTAKQVEDLLYQRSGLLGVSGGIASDMRTLLDSDAVQAKEAVELFVFRIAREVGALTSSLGGLDGLVFSAGIGEHAPAIREMVCARLGWLGVELDQVANRQAKPNLISTPKSRIDVRVIPTDEEAMIARHTLDVVRPKSSVGT